MVIRAIAPPGMHLSTLIEAMVNEKLRKPQRKPKPLDRYLTVEVVSNILDIRKDYILDTVAQSDTLHGAIYEGQLYIHPQSVIEYVKDKFREVIKKELKR